MTDIVERLERGAALEQSLDFSLNAPDALMREAAALIQSLRARIEEMGWCDDMSKAPKGMKLIVGYRNGSDKWRSIMATYYPPGTLDADESLETEDGFAPEGWYEESETHDNLLPCQPPTHWRHLLTPPNPHTPSP